VRAAVTPIPVTLLTGFLGAGKTTLVNHLLTASHGRKLAVIVNEFGALGIDAALIRGTSGSVIELANGCICCATQGDLRRAVHEVLQAADHLDGLLIETSGLADPEPVVDSLEATRFGKAIRLDGVITVIDAENFDANLDQAEAAYRQIVCGDVLLINKTDLVEAEIPDLIEQGIRHLNPEARVVRCVSCRVPLDVLLGAGRPAATGNAPAALDHDHDFQSAVLVSDRPLDPERFDAWLSALPPSIYRAKGFVRFVGQDAPLTVHVVGARRSVEPAPAGLAVAGAQLVVIGRGVSITALKPGFDACAG